MTKYVTCPKNEEHTVFRRRVRIEADTFELVDSAIQSLELQTPVEASVVRRFSDLECATCRSRVTVRLTH